MKTQTIAAIAISAILTACGTGNAPNNPEAAKYWQTCTETAPGADPCPADSIPHGADVAYTVAAIGQGVYFVHDENYQAWYIADFTGFGVVFSADMWLSGRDAEMAYLTGYSEWIETHLPISAEIAQAENR